MELEKKEKELQTTLEEMDASVKQLQQGLSKEPSLAVGTVDLKLQLEGALCKQQQYGEELEQKVKDSISIDEHKVMPPQRNYVYIDNNLKWLWDIQFAFGFLLC